MKYALMLAIVIMLIAATGQTHDTCNQDAADRRHDEHMDLLERGNNP